MFLISCKKKTCTFSFNGLTTRNLNKKVLESSADLLMARWIAAVASMTLLEAGRLSGWLTPLCTHKLVCVSSSSFLFGFCLSVCLCHCLSVSFYELGFSKMFPWALGSGFALQVCSVSVLCLEVLVYLHLWHWVILKHYIFLDGTNVYTNTHTQTHSNKTHTDY